MVKAFTVSILSMFFSSDHNAFIIEQIHSIGALDPGSAKQKLIRHLMLTAFMFSFVKLKKNNEVV
jgi:hypothetical protein